VCRKNHKEAVTDRFRIETLEERIAPTVTGTGGYDGQPGNQSSAQGNPSGSANPENNPGH
jgi:hypothetical protein